MLEFALIGILAVLAFLCLTGELQSYRRRRRADELIRLRSGNSDSAGSGS